MDLLEVLTGFKLLYSLRISLDPKDIYHNLFEKIYPHLTYLYSFAELKIQEFTEANV
jgi:hypothetical protein